MGKKLKNCSFADLHVVATYFLFLSLKNNCDTYTLENSGINNRSPAC
jgi:hypothetical protein